MKHKKYEILYLRNDKNENKMLYLSILGNHTKKAHQIALTQRKAQYFPIGHGL